MVIPLLVVVLAGMLSVLTPCILPLLPALLVVSDGEGRWRPWGIIIGVVASFCATILLLTWLVDLLGIPSDVLRYVSAALLLLFGLILLVPALEHRFQLLAGRLARFAPRAGTTSDGFGSGLLAGATIGLVWAPCAGPILAGVTSTVAREGITGTAVLLTIGYGIGMLVPLTIVVFAGRRFVDAMRRRLDNGRIALQVMGVVLVTTSALYFTGFDTKLNRAIAEHVSLTSTPIASLERTALDEIEDTDAPAASRDCADAEALVGDASRLEQAGYPEVPELCDLGPSPAIDAGDGWINTPDDASLTKADLHGKVVLVDVWTYSCINCIRTLPHLRRWYERYHDDGFEIVGVHAPEFAFEHDEQNVRSATKDLDVDWPVVLDNDFVTWNRFHNRYWPAKYLVDRDGTIRYSHYGEGGYAHTEQLIRELLGIKDAPVRADADDAIFAATPETYLGYERAQHRAGDSVLVPDKPHAYRAPGSLDQSEWAFDGTWTVEGERAIAGAGASVSIHYAATDVFLVAGPTTSARSTLSIRDGAMPARRIPVGREQLYTLRTSDDPSDRTMRIEVSPGTAVYAFTFG